MQVLLADEYGFCFGVERAVEMVEQAVGEGETVRSLGPLIHRRSLNHDHLFRIEGWLGFRWGEHAGNSCCLVRS